MSAPNERLRIALLAGTLGQGGAEKQLVYIAGALRDAGVDVTVLSLTRGEHHEAALREQGLEPTWVGRRLSPAARVAAIAAFVRARRPHVLLAGHFFVNLYARLATLGSATLGVGTARSDITLEVDANGRWGRWLLRAPSAMLVNSEVACRNAIARGRDPGRTRVLANVIDLARFDRDAANAWRRDAPPAGAVVAIAVGSLVPVKRIDRFLHALAAARAQGGGAPVVGWIVGDGPDRGALEALAATLGLDANAVRFLGRRTDVPALLRSADVLVLSSEHEGFPNTVLEAMAARLPVITTDAGDAARVVTHGETGFVVGDDPAGIARRIAELAASPDVRRAMGEAGRRRAEAHFAIDGLAARTLDALHALADACGARTAGSVLALAPR